MNGLRVPQSGPHTTLGENLVAGGNLIAGNSDEGVLTT